MIACPECGAEQYPGALYCRNCGAPVHPAAQAHQSTQRRPPDAPAVGDRSDLLLPVQLETMRPPVRTRRLHVRVADSDRRLTLTLQDDLEIGRADRTSSFEPGLDLNPYYGFERGVSRRHATIRSFEQGVVLIDRNSSNGTWLDGRQLSPGQAYLLGSEAAVRFGELLVHLTVED